MPKPIVNSRNLIPTGWPDVSQPFDPDGQPNPSTYWVKVSGPVESHKVFVDQVGNEQELMDGLVSQGIITG